MKLKGNQMNTVLIRWNPSLYSWRAALEDQEHCKALPQSLGLNSQYIPKVGDRIVILLTKGFGIVAYGEVVSNVITGGLNQQNDKYNISSCRQHTKNNKYFLISIAPWRKQIQDIEQYHKLKYMRRTCQKLNKTIFMPFLNSCPTL
jgi:hypothetical protein